jgi:hypothetical protein
MNCEWCEDGEEVRDFCNKNKLKLKDIVIVPDTYMYYKDNKYQENKWVETGYYVFYENPELLKENKDD